jgi:NifU-like protein involved in Fe-S cluster formation
VERVTEESRSKLQQLEELLGPEVLRRVVGPERRGAMADADGRGEFSTPCGDAMDLYVKVRDGMVTQASFVARGCAHTHACASAVAELMEGKSIAAARRDVAVEEISVLLGGLPEDKLHCASQAMVAARGALEDAIRTRQEPWRKLYRR